ncbi:hypothetical protein [Chitinivorax sp. B]|uniref:hypothetical protein n=1 Tax=Chitinivorax sp. B TaxID=2502235 RepID=UPI0010F957E7|nr:hypothetical protein [Chitinivorax sp. B]
MDKSVVFAASLSLCLGLTACGGGGGGGGDSDSTPKPTATPAPTAPVPSPVNPTPDPAPTPSPGPASKNVTSQRLLEGDVYSLHVDVPGAGKLGKVSVLQTQMSSSGVITDNHVPKRPVYSSPIFLHQLLSAHPFYAADYGDHTIGAMDFLDGEKLKNEFHAWGKRGWLTHSVTGDQATYRFQFEEVDLTDQLMKNNLQFSTGETKNGLLPVSNAKLVDTLGNGKFPVGSIGLRTHVVLPANKLLKVDNLYVKKDTAAGLRCIYTFDGATEGVGLMLGANTVDAFKVDGNCKATGSKFASGTFRTIEHTSTLGIVRTDYLLNFGGSGDVERLVLSPTYQKANARLSFQLSNLISDDETISVYFDDEVTLVDPQLHFNKTAINALKVQLGL